jgi:hypothetical protein
MARPTSGQHTCWKRLILQRSVDMAGDVLPIDDVTQVQVCTDSPLSRMMYP